jgi:hypothetical protein
MVYRIRTVLGLSLLFGCGDKSQTASSSENDTQDDSCIVEGLETAVEHPGFNFSPTTLSALDLGTDSIRLAEGTQENLIFSQGNRVHQYAPDGTLTQISESSTNISALHTRSDGQITSCLIDNFQVFMGDENTADPPTRIAQIHNPCDGHGGDEEIPCWSYLHRCHIQELRDGSISVAVHHTHGMDDQDMQDLYLTEDGTLAYVSSGGSENLIGLGWSGENNVLYKTGDTSVKLLSSTHESANVSLDGTSISDVSTAPARSALTTVDDAGVYVYGAASCPTLLERTHTLPPMKRPRVTTLNSGIIVVGQDETSGTFLLHGGGDTLEHTYDNTLNQVALVDVASTQSQIHILYSHRPDEDADNEYKIVTFDVT